MIIEHDLEHHFEFSSGKIRPSSSPIGASKSSKNWQAVSKMSKV